MTRFIRNNHNPLYHRYLGPDLSGAARTRFSNGIHNTFYQGQLRSTFFRIKIGPLYWGHEGTNLLKEFQGPF